MRSFILFLLSCFGSNAFAQQPYLLIGTYTGNGSQGIYVYHFNSSTGEASWVSNTDSSTTPNPSYLAITPNSKYVYAVYEEGGQKNGQISAYSFDHKNGKLSFINQQPSGGDHPCYVAVTDNGKWVAVANYTGGSLSVLPVGADGSLAKAAQVIQHTGKGANPSRQEKPHVHSTVFSPNNDYLFVADLGIDKEMIYKFNAAASKPLLPAQPSFVATAPGSGPRHFVFHPNKKFAYLIQELSGEVSAYQYSKGKLTLLQTVITHPADYKGTIGSADIHVSPDGKFLYASNRGDENTITIFSVNAAGKLKLVGYEPSRGKTPRNFVIDPSGNFLLVAHQNSNNIVVFKRNKQTGRLTYTGKEINVPNPVCLKIIK